MRAITDRMADRTSAEIFGWLFEELARLAQSPKPEVHDAAVDLASKAWAKARGYDFAWEQMEADEALLTLGLAKRVAVTNADGDVEDTEYEYLELGV